MGAKVPKKHLKAQVFPIWVHGAVGAQGLGFRV